ncbi:tetratricopeptide repeat protein [Litoreibacter halocynthiae]|uniref:Tetratricopeptide repeat protein n=1 Tax=Litoreibacter halocynthiae TaxID=1242689 RepID=A0A4R7LIB5_9RHOB|nr:tetratricopeptide repeat protein [Litoreibacter halocynthiae]TDT75543.1 tetratricopeptide repeat protein [Litoreibacter halocynthiae]
MIKTRVQRRIAGLLLSLAVSSAPAIAVEHGLAGPYLAARQATISFDYGEAARYYRRAVAAEPHNLLLKESAIIAMIGQGDISGATEIALEHEEAGGRNQIVDLVLDTVAVANGDFDRASEESPETTGLAPLLGGLTRAWALLGQGKMSDATDAFAKVAETEDFASFSHYHNALALASVGDFEGADNILSGKEFGPLVLSPRGIEAHAQILAQLERRSDAIELLNVTTANGFSAELESLKERLKADEVVNYDFVSNASEGIAEVYFNLSAVLDGRAAPEHVLLYVRMAQHIRPDHAPAVLMAAEILEGMGQFDLATEAYASLDTSSPAYVLAEIGRANALYSDDRKDAAVEVLTALSKSHGDIAMVHSTLGDILSRTEQNEGSVAAYSRALDLNGIGNRSNWRIMYARGIVKERMGDLVGMERDFRTALELSPNQPDILNYLGYSLVEQRIKLDEALQMIQTAVKESPDSGYITDSLGWIFYRLGRFEEAVAPMERAVELLPVDPIVNDHLGDVYWKVGREREAEFQWKRALSFKPEEAEAERIREKLSRGLTAVLEDEAKAGTTQTAND